MKKIIAFILILFLLACAGFAALEYADSNGLLGEGLLSDIHGVIDNALSDVLSYLNLGGQISYGDYSVTAVDGLGNPMPNVIVKFIDPNGEIQTTVTNKTGVASLKNILDCNYTVKLEKGFSTAIIPNTEYSLSAENRTLTLVLRDEEKSADIFGDVPDGSYACSVSEGSYTINSVSDLTSYYVFTARKSGIYRFSVTSDSDVTIGYYGGPMFVQNSHLVDGEYDGKSFEITVQDTMTPYVIGITASKGATFSFTVERIADAPFNPEHLAWTNVEMKADIEGWAIPDSAMLKDFDITDSTLSIVERDGLYYTADGKQVYIKIKSTAEAYLPGASLAYLAGFVDQQVGINIGGYIYDEEGNFVDKLSYNIMIKDYMDYCDSTYGVVPLTKELAECIQLHGRDKGWWNSESGNYLFDGYDIVEDNAWLFLCMISE